MIQPCPAVIITVLQIRKLTLGKIDGQFKHSSVQFKILAFLFVCLFCQYIASHLEKKKIIKIETT